MTDWLIEAARRPANDGPAEPTNTGWSPADAGSGFTIYSDGRVEKTPAIGEAMAPVKPSYQPYRPGTPCIHCMRPLNEHLQSGCPYTPAADFVLGKPINAAEWG